MVLSVVASLLLFLTGSLTRDVAVAEEAAAASGQSEFSKIGHFALANIGQGQINRNSRQPPQHRTLPALPASHLEHSFARSLPAHTAQPIPREAARPELEAARWVKLQPELTWRGSGRAEAPKGLAGMEAETRGQRTQPAAEDVRSKVKQAGVEDTEAVVALHQLKRLRPREEGIDAGSRPVEAEYNPPGDQLLPTTQIQWPGHLQPLGKASYSPQAVSQSQGVINQPQRVVSLTQEADSLPQRVVSLPQEAVSGPLETVNSSPDTGTTIQVTQEPATSSKQQLNLVEDVASEEPRMLPILNDKRTELGGGGVIHDLPQGDGLFLMTVMGVTLLCVVAVLGVGYCIHSPHCPPAPRSGDSSPTFQSTKLAFRSPTEEPSQPLDNSRVQEGGGAQTCQRTATSTLQRPTDFGTANKKSLGRMESLIDIDDDEEEDDDTIYECPGLAPPGEMVVTNPFFLSSDLHHLPPHLLPCPVNNNFNMKHGNINTHNNNN